MLLVGFTWPYPSSGFWIEFVQQLSNLWPHQRHAAESTVMTVSCYERFAEGSGRIPWLVSLVLGKNGRKVIYSLAPDEITLAGPDRIQPIAYGANVGSTQVMVDRTEIALEVCGHGPIEQMRSLENLRDWRRKALPHFCHLNALNTPKIDFILYRQRGLSICSVQNCDASADESGFVTGAIAGFRVSVIIRVHFAGAQSALERPPVL
jgi:hypothetical protein